LLPAVQANLNHTRVQSLAGRAPVEVFTALPASSTLDAMKRQRLRDMAAHNGIPANFDVGDFVLWSRIDQCLPNHKLLGHWVGPFKV
ncbi:hypothetical protein PHYSODRAFT_379596, partial [Phytophthora sojae]